MEFLYDLSHGGTGGGYSLLVQGSLPNGATILGIVAFPNLGYRFV